jgi:tripartite-type tricarboxylate transporter receptor subunit TctC
MRRLRRCSVLLLGATLLLAACGRAAPSQPPAAPPAGQLPAAQKPGAAAAEDVAGFYRGKTVTMIVHTTAGGGYDLYSRVLAEHLKKHIPGAPNMIVQNMPGGGGMIAANYLFNAARKDGTVIGTNNRGMPQAELGGTDGVQYRSKEINWLGSVNEEVSVCVARVDSGVSRFDDVYTRSLRVGGTGIGADTDFFPEVLNQVLGTKFEIITGYPGGNDINIALERGELQGRCGWSWSSVVGIREHWIQEPRFINVLVQMALNKHTDPRVQGVPLVLDLARSQADREVLELLFARQAMGRPYMAPPGVPPARLQALREAFLKTMEDPEFKADMEKAKLELNPVSGQQVQQLVDRMFSSRPELIERFKKIFTDAGGGAG